MKFYDGIMYIYIYYNIYIIYIICILNMIIYIYM